MKNSSANAQGVDSNSTDEHRFPWKWYLSDLKQVPKNRGKVFSCFSCGGGSSMGYKLAGFDVIGNVEIDPRMMEVYIANNHPIYSYLMDVRDFLKRPHEELPDALFDLDILDGSPPCSVFSTAGVREKGWGKEKTFREGQAKQRLDDLFIYFIQIAQKLQPRVVIAENVSGLIKGNAKGYVNEIFKAFDTAGYKTQLFLLNAAAMGVPQKRERTFFIAHRKDMALPKLTLAFSEPPIYFGRVRSAKGVPFAHANGTLAKLSKARTSVDMSLGDVAKRLLGRDTAFGNCLLHDNRVAFTLTAKDSGAIRFCDGMKASKDDVVAISTFPQDYNFLDQSPTYICGMCVPPVMMAQVATQVYEQWLKSEE